MAIPSEFTCAGCKNQFVMTEMSLPDMVDPMSEEEINAICDATHPNFGIICDTCKSVYDSLRGQMG